MIKLIGLKKSLNNETKKVFQQGVLSADPIEYRQSVMDSVINLDVRFQAMILN